MASAVGQYNIRTKRGATLRIVITRKDSNGVVIPNTGHTANMDVKTLSGVQIVNFNTTPLAGQGSITMGGSNGQITLLLPSAAAEAILAGTYKYDLYVDDGTDVIALLEGQYIQEGQSTQTMP